MALNRSVGLRAFCLFLLLLLQWPAQAGQAIKAPFYEAARGKQVVYVLGTVHVGKADFYPLRHGIEQALRASSQLYLELHPDEVAEASQQVDHLLCERPCLQAALTEQEWKLLGQRLGNQAEALAAMEKFEPWIAAIVLSLGDMIALGYSPELGVEQHLEKIAGKDKTMIGLETAAEQLSLFTNMQPAEQKELLVQWLNMSARDRARISQDMMRLWQAGDADAMYRWYEQVSHEFRGSPETEAAFHRKFVVERNHSMVNRLLARLRHQNQPVFLAVGAIHLGGPDGVLNLLRRQGFAVRPR